jgi:hypothetical protein
MKLLKFTAPVLLVFFLTMSCKTGKEQKEGFIGIHKDVLADKIKGAWAMQTIGVTYGGPVEFHYKNMMIPDSVQLEWSDTMMYHWMTKIPGLYDDIYMDLTFVDVFQKEGLNAPVNSFANAYAHADYFLWHANQQGRYNILNGIMPPASGSWLNNPHADDIDFQIESDFAGIMNPGMPESAIGVCNKIGHIMNSGDGYYGGVFISSLYSYAFILNNIKEIVNKALSAIPPQSNYYKCISDAVQFYEKYPNDWKSAWTELQQRWGAEIGCPDGAGSDFDIDAKLNSAYVVLGLLYGNGDVQKTMEIAARCGQDADCNPSSAAGVLGAMIGYKAIPPKWSAGLPSIEDLDFKYTTVSLNDVYRISLDHAMKMIVMNGGDTTGNEVQIKLQQPETVPLEVNFPDYKLAETVDINKKIDSKTRSKLYEASFDGIGFVLRGEPGNSDFDKSYSLLSPEETHNDFVLQVKCTIDNNGPFTVDLPLNFLKRNTEIVCYKYELAPGKHHIKIEPLNLEAPVNLKLWNMLVYTK